MNFNKLHRIEDRDVLNAVKGQPCVVCRRPSDPCHIKSNGSGGDDTHWNLMPLCRNHHTEQHKIGWITFMRKYKAVEMSLASKGWYLNELGRLWNDFLNKR